VHRFVDRVTAHTFRVISAVRHLQHARRDARIEPDQRHDLVHCRVAVDQQLLDRGNTFGAEGKCRTSRTISSGVSGRLHGEVGDHG